MFVTEYKNQLKDMFLNIFKMVKTKKFDKKAFAIASLRRASYRLRSRTDALKAAKIARNQYKCNTCKGIFGRSEIHLDHIEPVVPYEGWQSFDDFIDRLFIEDHTKFQVLCKPDHKIKSKMEAGLRKFHRDAKKKKEQI